MNIAIIDSSLNKDILDENLNKRIFIRTVNPMAHSEREILHSSMIINVLEKYSIESVNYILYEIMDAQKGETSEFVVQAVNDSISQNVSIIILCLSVRMREPARLWAACEKAKDNNVIVLAACRNDSEISIPAIFSNVIGIKRGIVSSEPYCYQYFKDDVQLIGDASPEFIRCKGGRFRLFGGTSKAVPKTIAFFQTAVRKNNTKFLTLERYMKNNIPFPKNILNTDLINSDVIDNSILSEISDIAGIKKGYNRKNVNTDSSIFEYIEDENEIDLFLKEIFKRFCLEIDLSDLRFFQFSTIRQLTFFIQTKLRRYEDESI